MDSKYFWYWSEQYYANLLGQFPSNLKNSGRFYSSCNQFYKSLFRSETQWFGDICRTELWNQYSCDHKPFKCKYKLKVWICLIFFSIKIEDSNQNIVNISEWFTWNDTTFTIFPKCELLGSNVYILKRPFI